jgi:hypothetical protein
MLYYFFGYLDKVFDFPGARMFQYISFRAGMAVIVSLIISMILGKSLINLLKKMQVKESIRDLGLEGQKEKEGTPTMGGAYYSRSNTNPDPIICRPYQHIYYHHFDYNHLVRLYWLY